MSANRVRVTLLNHVTGIKTRVEVPADVPMRRLIPALAGKLGLPTDQNGQPVTYRMDKMGNDGQTAERIGEEQTLAEAQVENDMLIALFPEVTAGAMLNPLVRKKRLNADWERLLALHNRKGLITIEEKAGDPPEMYVIRFDCRGIAAINQAQEPQYIDTHRVALRMTATYPAEQPLMKWLTPIFHPNITGDGEAICIGAWLPTMTLDELVWMLGEMAQYKNYASYNPLNLQASLWAMQHRDLFPVDKRMLVPTIDAKQGSNDVVDIKIY